MSAQTLRVGGIEYTAVPESAVPAGLRWDVPPSMQGQTVEREFGHVGRDCSDVGDPWMRITDRSGGPVAYWRRDEASR